MAAESPSRNHPPGAGPDVELQGAEARCSGCWTADRLHQVERRLAGLAWPSGAELVLDCSAVEALDTAGTWLLQATVRDLERRGRRVALRLRPEHRALLEMIRSPALAEAEPAPRRPTLLARVGRWALGSLEQALAMVAFVGESAVAGARAIAQPSHIRWRSVLHEVQTAGFDALPIVGLLSFLLGLVIAYQGAGPLARYGANTFVADLVGLAMLRELAPLITAIVVAGRSGSAWAAQIGTMRVTEEIDALRTVGIDPLEFLVLPKILALVVALPLLTVFSDALGVLGGMVMSRSELGLRFEDFLDRFVQGVRLPDYLVGVGKAPVFAAVIALVGCHQGFRVSGDAESVGRHTTVSVVQSIFAIVVVDALFSVVFSWLGI